MVLIPGIFCWGDGNGEVKRVHEMGILGVWVVARFASAPLVLPNDRRSDS